jgi:hypothetical protein
MTELTRTKEDLRSWALSLKAEGNSLGDALMIYANAWSAEVMAQRPEEGTVLVPLEPTVVQANAGADADDLRTGFETVKHIYRAMVKASPFMNNGERSK